MAKVKLGKFTCPKCSRTFSMAAHLARHQNTMHAAGGKRKVVKRKKTRGGVSKKIVRAAARRAKTVRGTALGQTPLLRQMQTYRGDLIAQRDRVSAQIDAIDRALAALGAGARRPAARPVRGTRRGKGPRRGSLKDYTERVLRAHGRAMAVKDVTAAVRRAGFKTTNKTLAKSVGIALTQLPNVVRVSRGTFRLK